MKFKFLAAFGFAAILYSCDDTTTGVGDFVANEDEIEAFADTYTIKTNTMVLNSVYSRTSNAYLGKYTDPDFGLFSADFITQINCTEEFEFPETIQGITETNLELFYSSYFGDSLATQCVQVYPLSEVIPDDGKHKDLYYTSLDLMQYVGNNQPLANKYYAAFDNSVSDSIRNLQNYVPSVSINLDKGPYEGYASFSDYLYEKYKENDHANFKDAHSFINNVLKGFYVHTTHGEGSILYIHDIWLQIKIAYLIERPSTGKIDSLVHTVVPFSATKEVFMSTRLENADKLNQIAENEKSCTYLKTPAGLCTEITLPLDEMYQNLQNDTLNSISVTFTKYKDKSTSPHKMGTPKYLLMVRKNEMKDFFEENKTFDNITSFLATYDSSTKTYKFSKLNRLVSHIFSGIKSGKEQKQEGWDRVLLIPVQTETDSQNNIIGVSHDMEVNSARLFGGENGEEVQIQVIYTRPQNRK